MTEPERARSEARGARAPDRLACLKALEQKILWLSAWTIHNANHLRDSRDGLKVGGHQASCASLVTLMTALYLDVLRPHDRVAVKPHASPVFHAIQYLLGQQTQDKLAGLARCPWRGSVFETRHRRSHRDHVEDTLGRYPMERLPRSAAPSIEPSDSP
jgi:pyruvate dehydrogenase complex dehydrogenase (E1) component